MGEDGRARLVRVKAGRDDIRYAEQDATIGACAAQALADARRVGLQLTGCPGPRWTRLVIGKEPPRPLSVLLADPIGWLWLAPLFVGLLASLVAHTLWPLWVSYAAGLYGLLIWKCARLIRRWWPNVSGLAWRGMLGGVILVHWPPPSTRPESVDAILRRAETPEQWIRYVVAHEYGHCLLRALRRRLPRWLDHGFADWFAEQVLGETFWRPESKSCLAETEPKLWRRYRDLGRDSYYRLMARYYWEVRALADAECLIPQLRAPARELQQLRVSETKRSGLYALPPAPDGPRPRLCPLQVSGLLAAVGLTFGLIFWIWHSDDPADQVMQRYFAALRRNDFAAALADYSPAFFRHTSRADAGHRMEESARKLGRLESYENAQSQWEDKTHIEWTPQGKRTSHARRYTLRYIVVYHRGTADETFVLERRDGRLGIVEHRSKPSGVPRR